MAGEPIPKQPRRTSLEPINEATAGSTQETFEVEPDEIQADSNAVELAPVPDATPTVCVAVMLQGNSVPAVQSGADNERIHTPNDLESVTPSLEADKSPQDEIPAGITTPVEVFLNAVEPVMPTAELSDMEVTAATSEVRSSSAFAGSASLSSSEDDAGGEGSSDDHESVRPTADMLINEVWNSC